MKRKRRRNHKYFVFIAAILFVAMILTIYSIYLDEKNAKLESSTEDIENTEVQKETKNVTTIIEDIEDEDEIVIVKLDEDAEDKLPLLNNFSKVIFLNENDPHNDYYLEIIHSIPEEYLEGLDKIQINDVTKNKYMLEGGEYTCYSNFIVINSPTWDFKRVIKHELVHFQLDKEKRCYKCGWGKQKVGTLLTHEKCFQDKAIEMWGKVV